MMMLKYANSRAAPEFDFSGQAICTQLGLNIGQLKFVEHREAEHLHLRL